MNEHAMGNLNGSAPHNGAKHTVSGTSGTSGIPGTNNMNGSKGSNGNAVIDLRDAPPTRVRVERDNNPFTSLSKPERMKLIIRVLCEIVAYGESDGAVETLAE